MINPLSYLVRATSTAAAARPRTASDHDGGPMFQPQTELGRRLWELRQQIVASGEPLLDAEQVEAEVDRRRGGVGLGQR